jgi:glycosyltransferase involved in cell wall biosynthesis
MIAETIGQKISLVSVLVPMLNAEAFIEDALRSVLRERDISIEVVVVDDGSKDRSRAVVQALGDARIRIVDGPQRGISACLNVAVTSARGQVIMRCDADDAYPPGRIARQVAWLEAHPEQDAICGAFSTIDTAGALLAHVGVRDGPDIESIEAELRRGVARTHLCTFAIRRRVFDRVGLFREYFETAEDVDFQLRMGEVCRVSYMPVDAYMYRLHGASITHSRGDQRRMFFDDAAIRFQEQRLSSGADDLTRGEAPDPPPRADASKATVRAHVYGMLVGQAWRDLREGNVRSSVARAWRAVSTHPFHLGGWVNFGKILFRVAFPK